MKKLIILVCLWGIASQSAIASYRRQCVVKYETQEGWSKKYTVEVTFATGYELNEATNSFNYSSYSTYAVIFWGEGKATVIKLKTFTVCGTEVTKDCIENTYGDLKGNDQDGDVWNICVSDYYCY